jgi:hypothetical protein
MSWYAAHLIVYFKRRKGPQKRFLVWENIVLIRAKSSDEAYEKAEQLGREDAAVDDKSTHIGGHPCRVVFAGVRKVTLCQDQDTRPTDGTEVSYNELVVRSEAAIEKLVAGKSVTAEIQDPFPDDALAESGPASLPGRTGS